MTDVLTTFSRALLGPAPRVGRRAATRASSAVATVATAVGLFTVSWDRLANLSLGGYNVKLTALAFSVAAAASLPLLRASGVVRGSKTVRAGALTVLAVLAVLILSSAMAERPLAGLAQVVAVLTGAIAPAVAVVAVARGLPQLVWVLRWFTAGAVLTCAFGIYQLIAFYTGLPQVVTYTGVGVDGSAGRIAAFSYEPAYFANFVVLAFGAAATLALIEKRRLGWVPVGAFAVVLVLANVRALFFLVPVLAVLLALRWRQNRGLLLRGVVAAAVVVALNAGIPLVVDQITAAGHTESAAPAPAVRDEGAPASASAPPPPAASTAADSPTNVLNPNEQSSNAPRLALYRAVLDATAGQSLLGVGPGNLRNALERVGYVAPNQGSQVVANNVWLQAYADGGAVLVVLELGLVALVVIVFFRRRNAVVQPLAAAWLAVLAVSGMLTSYFFDAKMWVVLGALLAAAALHDGPTPQDRANSSSSVSPSSRRVAGE